MHDWAVVHDFYFPTTDRPTGPTYMSPLNYATFIDHFLIPRPLRSQGASIHIWRRAAKYVRHSPYVVDHLPLVLATTILYLNAYAAGYLLSFLLPYEACGMAAVGWGICWGLMFGGLSLTMAEDTAQFKNNLMLISSARWYNEAVWYASTMYPFSVVREGPSAGEDYYDLEPATRALCFFKTTLEACGCATACLLFWLAFDLFLIIFTKLDKKK